MPRAKGKSNKGGAALMKAVNGGSHVLNGGAPLRELNTTCLDFKTAAAVSEFTIEERGIDASKRAPAKQKVKTVFAQESRINVDHRIRIAAVPMGVDLGDDAFIAETLSVEGFTSTPARFAKRLMPKRPHWSYEITSGRLHHREVEGFKQWLEDIRQLFAERGGYPPAFEQNLQVWRQLWRVLERSDVAVLVVDARHPLLHLPPALVYHVARTLAKPLVVVLNKLDTVDPQVARRWAEVLKQDLPGIAGVVGYSKESLRHLDFDSLQVGRDALINECHRVHESFTAKRRAAMGPRAPQAAAASAVATAAPAAAEVERQEAQGEPADGSDAEAEAALAETEAVAAPVERLVLGMVGHPNVGKSSLINSIMGNKVVSVKATPGHTKTMQTLNLDASTCLCDCPGVVFPRLEVPREAQIVGMLIPLAQIREPYSALRWVMMHAVKPLHELLSVKVPTLQRVLELRDLGLQVLSVDSAVFDEDDELPWSPMLLCAQFAVQRGMVGSGGPDCHRAGMEILERVLDGRVPYAVPPPAAAPQGEGHAWLRKAAAGTGGASGARTGEHGGEEEGEEDSDSGWEVDDDGYKSETYDPDVKAALDRGDLLGFFGEGRDTPGGTTCKSRSKKKKKEKLQAAEQAVAGADKD